MDKKIIETIQKISFEILKDNKIIESENFDLRNAGLMDSVTRIAILTALEAEYDFLYKLKEVSSWNTIYELAAITQKKLK